MKSTLEMLPSAGSWCESLGFRALEWPFVSPLERLMDGRGFSKM